MCSNIWLTLKDLLSLEIKLYFFLQSKLSYLCYLALFNVVKCKRFSTVGMYAFILKKLLPMSTNMHIWKYRFAYTSDIPSWFKISASTFVKELEVWFKTIINLVSFEEGQARGRLFTPEKVVIIDVIASHLLKNMK